MRKRLLVAVIISGLSCIFAAFSGCVTHTPAPQATLPNLSKAEIVRGIPPSVKDREGWAEDILAAIKATNKEPTAERVCAVLAVVAQESGFQVDPVVSELPRIVREGLEKKFERLGILARPAIAALLEGKAPDSHLTFAQRINQLRTERDLDRLFRDLSSTYREKLPGTFAVTSALSMLLGKGSLRDLNPVTTAGSMQVKVSFAQSMEGNSSKPDEVIREELYTRAGGLRYGTARLLDYSASYGDIIYRFADYNAGLYASRNAAFQSMLASLTRKSLLLDGDVLSYDDDGDPKAVPTNSLKALLAFGALHDISEWTIERDANKEKSADFEDTKSWQEVRAAWEKKTGKTAPYALMPEVQLNSPKLLRTRSTAWFAGAVKRRYQECREKVSKEL